MQPGPTKTLARASTVTTDVAGLCHGTVVLTRRGEVPVQDLRPGDRLVTRDAGLATVSYIAASRARFAPVRIRAGSLGHNRPDRDMVTAPGTKLYVRDWRAQALYGADQAAVPAARLIDGEYVAATAPVTTLVYRIAFDRPHVIYAGGVEVVVGD